jgi:hypothetical protein
MVNSAGNRLLILRNHVNRKAGHTKAIAVRGVRTPAINGEGMQLQKGAVCGSVLCMECQVRLCAAARPRLWEQPSNLRFFVMGCGISGGWWLA